MKINLLKKFAIHSRAAQCGLALLALVAAPAQGGIVYFDNLTQPVEDNAGFDNTYMLAQSFLTDTSSPLFALNAVTLSMDDGDATGGNFFVSLYSNGANIPGTFLEALSGNSDPLTAGNYSYSSTGTVLGPNALYWVVISATNPTGEYNWNYTNSTTTTGSWVTPGWTDSLSAGVSWNTMDPSAPQMMSITATAIPEPATTGLIIAVGGLLVTGWCKRKSRATG